MTSPFVECPIPPWAVAVESDGCFWAWVSLPQAWGTHEQCAQFIANHLPPRGYDFNIYPVGGDRRLMSYTIPPATVARRVRLTVQDLHA